LSSASSASPTATQDITAEIDQYYLRSPAAKAALDHNNRCRDINGRGHFLQLPSELRLAIFKDLDNLNDVANLRLVCTGQTQGTYELLYRTYHLLPTAKSIAKLNSLIRGTHKPTAPVMEVPKAEWVKRIIIEAVVPRQIPDSLYKTLPLAVQMRYRQWEAKFKNRLEIARRQIYMAWCLVRLPGIQYLEYSPNFHESRLPLRSDLSSFSEMLLDTFGEQMNPGEHAAGIWRNRSLVFEPANTAKDLEMVRNMCHRLVGVALRTPKRTEDLHVVIHTNSDRALVDIETADHMYPLPGLQLWGPTHLKRLDIRYLKGADDDGFFFDLFELCENEKQFSNLETLTLAGNDLGTQCLCLGELEDISHLPLKYMRVENVGMSPLDASNVKLAPGVALEIHNVCWKEKRDIAMETINNLRNVVISGDQIFDKYEHEDGDEEEYSEGQCFEEADEGVEAGEEEFENDFEVEESQDFFIDEDPEEALQDIEHEDVFNWDDDDDANADRVDQDPKPETALGDEDPEEKAGDSEMADVSGGESDAESNNASDSDMEDRSEVEPTSDNAEL
jgi:hypothetical protein